MPNNSVNWEMNKTANVILDVECGECRRSTKHRVLASADVDGEDWFGRNSVQYWVHYQIVQCQGCESTTYRTSSENSEDYDFNDENQAVLNRTVTLLPNRNEGRNIINDAHLLPSNIQRIYGETIKALNNDQPVLAGIGIRALIETICKDKAAPGSNLMGKIDGLVSLGVLTADGATVLHKIRTLGNYAAHEVKPHTPTQLGLALDVCEHLLQGAYLLPFFAERTFT